MAAKLIEVILYECFFWLKKVDSLARIAEAVYSISNYPLSYLRGKMLFFLTDIVPMAFIATIPTLQ